MDHKYNPEYPYRGGQGDLAIEERGGEVITEAQGWNGWGQEPRNAGSL